VSGDALSARGGTLSARGLSVDGAGRGILLEDGVNASLTGIALSRMTGEGIRAEGGSLRAEDLAVEGAASGLSLKGVETSASRVTLTRLAEDGVRAEGGTLILRASRVEHAARGASLSGVSATFEDASFGGLSAGGVESSLSRLEAAGLVIEAAGADALLLRDSEFTAVGARLIRPASAALRATGSRVSLRDARLEGGQSGLLSWDGEAVFSSCVLTGQRDAALRQERGSLSLASCEIKDCGSGAVVPVGRLEVRGGSIARCAGAALECGGPLRAGGLLVYECGAGVKAGHGSSVELESVEFRALAGHGVELRGGALSASDCRWTGVGGVGVRLEEEARARLVDCALRGVAYGVGATSGQVDLRRVRVVEASRAAVSLEAGSHRLESVAYYACADGLHAVEGARVDIIGPVRRPRLETLFDALKRRVLRLVLSTRRLPAAARLYRAACAAPLRLLQARAALDPGAVYLGVHRSWKGQDWAPGTSDVDLLSCERSLSGDGGARRLERLWRSQTRLKRAFPFLGERLVMEEEDLLDYGRWGGFRARGLGAQFQTLAGRLPAFERARSPAESFEALGESAHAYTRLMVWALWSPRSQDWAAMQARKAALDLLRLEAAGPGGPAELPPRAAASSIAAGTAGEALIAPLEALDRGVAGAAAALCAAAAALIDVRAGAALAAVPSCGASRLRVGERPPREAPSSEWDGRRRRRAALESAMGPALVAGCCDDLYRSLLVLSDESVVSGGAERAFAGLASAMARGEGPNTIPLVLSQRAWRAWSRLPYLESPLGFVDSGGETERLVPAGAGVPGVWLHRWGSLRAVDLPDDWTRALAREARAVFRCIWRHQISPVSGLSEAYGLHYALSRALGLKLLIERGLVASPFDLDGARALYAREFPGEAPGLRALDGAIVALDRPAAWMDYYAWVDGTLRGSA
jgi:hypothetical protein